MKPSPPDFLLARGQEWTVVEASWGLLPGPYKEKDQFTCSGYHCEAVGVVYNMDQTRLMTETLCLDHIGNHRWIAAGKVWQWRADPPFDDEAHKRKVNDARAKAYRAYLRQRESRNTGDTV